MSVGDLTEKVQKWLTSSGYPLEMKVAVAFQKAGFRVFQSDSYSDPDTNENREIDVFAFDTFENDDFVVRLHFIIECKVSSQKPWVMFLSHSHGVAKPAYVSQQTANGLGRSFLRAISQTNEAQRIPLLSNAQPMAYGMTEALGGDGNSNCYKAITSATKAAISSAKRTSGQISFDNYLNVYLPVIVLDGHLFQALPDLEHNEPRVIPVEQGRLVLRSPAMDMPHTFINVVSLSALDDFVKTCRASCDKLFEIADSHRSKITARIKRHKDYIEP